MSDGTVGTIRGVGQGRSEHALTLCGSRRVAGTWSSAWESHSIDESAIEGLATKTGSAGLDPAALPGTAAAVRKASTPVRGLKVTC